MQVMKFILCTGTKYLVKILQLLDLNLLRLQPNMKHLVLLIFVPVFWFNL